MPYVFGGIVTFVSAHDVFDVALHADLSVVDPHGAVAQLGEEFVGVAGEHQDAGAFHQLLQPDASLLHEFRVDGTDALVEKQDLGIDAGDDAHGNAHAHAGGVGAQRHREVFTELVNSAISSIFASICLRV